MENTNITISNLSTVTTFAKTQGVTRATVYNWINSGLLKQVDFLGKKFVDKSTLLKIR